MNARRSFLRKALAGVALTPLASSLPALARPGGSKPYRVSLTFAFDPSVEPKQLIQKMQNLEVAERINAQFRAGGRLVSFDTALRGHELRCRYTFDCEASYLDWETQMVLERVLDRAYCKSIKTQEGDLGPEFAGFHKLVTVHVA